MPQELNLRLVLSVSALALVCASSALAQGPRSNFIIETPTPPPQTFAVDPQKPAKPADTPKAVEAPAPKPTEKPTWAGTNVAPPPSLAPITGEGAGPDETALRYYAAMNQTARASTEIARLRRLYPEWAPPENLYEATKVAGDDEQQYWDLFTADRMDELRGAIEARRREEPGWNPSPDLASKVRSKSLRVKIMDLWKSGKLSDLTDFVKTEGFGGDEADVDVMWTVAESYARTKQTSDAVNIFKKILTENKDPGQRLATIQKAMSCLRMIDVEPLIAMGKVNIDGKGEFGSISLDITRARVSAFLHDERAEEIPAEEMKAFEVYAKASSDPNQPGLVAWYYYKTKVFRASLEWFKFALEHGGDAMIAHGLAHSLRELGMYRETEEVSYAWREPLINNTILFIDILERDLTKEIPPYIEPERLQRYAQVTMDLSSGEGAQGLAWYAYNTCQYDVAYEWFQRANAWSPKEATAYGLAVLTRKLGKSREFVDLVNRYDGLFPKVVELLFPDNMYHPPSPCDLLLASEKDRQRLLNQAMMNAAATAPVDPSYAAARQAGYAVAQSPAGAIAPQTQPGFQQAAVAPANPLAPAQQGYPVQQAYPQGYGARYDQPPKINRAEFPVSVNPENSLRYSSTGKLMGAVAPLGKAPPPQNPVAANEPWRGVQPLVARRVPGVGAMPYEHYGFSLLPGWTGVLTASAPHTAETAPAGTLWTTLQAKDAQSTRGGTFGTDAMRQDPAGLMRMIAGAPRVPPPTAVQIAPPQVRVSQTPINMSQAPPPIMTMASLAEPAPVGPPPPKVLDGARDDAAKYALELYKNGDYAGAVEALDRRGGVSIEPVDLRLVRAWSLMHLNRSEEARSIFASLDKKTGAGTASIMPKSYGAKPAAKAALAKPAAANAGAPTPPVRPKIAKASPAGNH